MQRRRVTFRKIIRVETVSSQGGGKISCKHFHARPEASILGSLVVANVENTHRSFVTAIYWY